MLVSSSVHHALQAKDGLEQLLQILGPSVKRLYTQKLCSLTTNIAVSQPHAAYAAFTRGLSSRWTLSWTSKTYCCLYRKCYSSTTHSSLTGGLGLSNPATSSPDVFQASQRLTASLVDLIVVQDVSQIVDPEVTSTIKKNIRKSNHLRNAQQASNINGQLLP